METRKIIAFGRNSFVVSLPKQWVDKYNMRKGDELFISQAGDTLSVSPSNIHSLNKPREITLHMRNKKMDYLETEIIWAYLTNFDSITVRCDTKFERKKLLLVKEVMQNLAGLEIMEETTTKITARDLINISQISIEKTIRRIDIMVRGMMNDAKASLDEDNYDSIFDRDDDVNRLVFLAYRIMRSAVINPTTARELNLSFLDILTYWHILMRLEKIGDQCKRISRFSREADMPPKRRKMIKEIFGRVIEDYEGVMKVYYMKRREEAFRLANAYKEEVEDLHALLKDPCDPPTVNIIENLKSMTSSIKHIARSMIGGG
ncbi:MAG: phosphate uptake regulator PhoU [Nanoarchaeota archaeon]